MRSPRRSREVVVRGLPVEVEPVRVPDWSKRATNARKAYFANLARKSARSRREAGARRRALEELAEATMLLAGATASEDWADEAPAPSTPVASASSRGVPLRDRAAFINDAPVGQPQLPRRHACVTGPTDSPGAHPGMVVAWERRGDGWWAHMVWIVVGEGTVVQQWLPARLIEPA